MPDIIAESLLEMYFFQAQVKHFESVFGAKFLRLLKPSPQKEAWVGFDQGWVRTSVSNEELFDRLKTAIQSEATSSNHFYLGYFLQFKTVQRIVRRSKHFPTGFSIPYFRSELSLEPNKTTRLSQHETLLRLSRISFASVSYACAMLFDLDDLYEEPDLGRLRCVDLLTAPTGWATNEPHFIAFRTENDLAPLWCSQPVVGKALGFKEWASPDSKTGPKKLTAEEITNLITTVYKEMLSTVGKREPPLLERTIRFRTRSLPECLVIIEFTETTTTIKRDIRMIRPRKANDGA